MKQIWPNLQHFRRAHRWAIPTASRCWATPNSPCGTRRAATCDFGSGPICHAEARRIPRWRRSRWRGRMARPFLRKRCRCSTSMARMDNRRTPSRRPRRRHRVGDRPGALVFVHVSGHAPGAAQPGCRRRLAALPFHRSHRAELVLLRPRGHAGIRGSRRRGRSDDVMHFEVCAPDRTMALIYDHAGEKTVKVRTAWTARYGICARMWKCDAPRRQERPGLPLPGNAADRGPQGRPGLSGSHVGTVVRSFPAEANKK